MEPDMESESTQSQLARQARRREGTHHRHSAHLRRQQLRKLAQRLAIAAFVLLVVLASLYVWMAGLRD
jgi:hypothetical protein